MEQLYRDPCQQQQRVAEKIGVLVAWPSGNGPRHLGHGAALLPGDVIARYHRSLGNEVLMVSGTDEYGTPNMIAAEEAHQNTQDFVDHTNELIRNDFIGLGMSFDWFTRTTSPEHTENAQRFFSKLVDAGYIDKGTMLGAFDDQTKQALPDRYVEGGCPHCGASSRGDQCDSCSNLLEPTELINPISKITQNPVDFRNTEHYFLNLDRLSGDVTEWLEANDNLRPNARSFSIEMAKKLRPRAITRDMDWGIPLPEDYELADDNDKVLYVWFEAVIGYVSASIEWAKHSEDSEQWKTWWQNSEAQHFYFLGKDNVPFHTLIWPAMIAAANKSGYSDGNLKQPDIIASTEYLTFNEAKLSTSRGNVIYISDLLNMVGPDALRYYLIAAGPETHDVNFSFHEFARRTNDELIAKWGNLVNRSSSLIQKNHENKIPVVNLSSLTEEDNELLDFVKETYDEVGDLINTAKFSAALKRAFGAVAAVNKYIFNAEPWKTVKSDRTKAGRDMFVVMTAIQNINTILGPFLPHASQKVHEMYGGKDELMSQPQQTAPYPDKKQFTVLTGNYSANKGTWKFRYAQPGQELAQIGHLFEKLDETTLEEAFVKILKQRALGALSIEGRFTP